jgi:hypothetical protein
MEDVGVFQSCIACALSPELQIIVHTTIDLLQMHLLLAGTLSVQHADRPSSSVGISVLDGP